MALSHFLTRIVTHLDTAQVPYMLSGSIASAHYGEPRATQDVDIVVDLDSDGLERLLRELDPERYYVSPEAGRDAVRRRSQFNVIDFETGWKADLIVVKRRPFSQEEFRRRRQATVLEVSLQIASPEDVVLAKLEWARRSGGSERQLRDVHGVLAAPGQPLDLTYLQRWAVELGVADLLQSAQGDLPGD